jgi:hypothetical protein
MLFGRRSLPEWGAKIKRQKSKIKNGELALAASPDSGKRTMFLIFAF